MSRCRDRSLLLDDQSPLGRYRMCCSSRDRLLMSGRRDQSFLLDDRSPLGRYRMYCSSRNRDVHLIQSAVIVAS